MPDIYALLSSVLHAGLGWLSRTRPPLADGSLRLKGLHGAAEVIRDRWGVPHIYAEDLHDLLFAQGFVHAQDRMWQMDFNRRLVAGRLAEVLGAVALPLDRWVRTLTMRRVAEYEVGLLDQEAREQLESYAAGINAFIAQGRLPIEFLLLRYRPELWTVADTLAWIKMMSWTLSVNWETEILRAQLVARLGAEQAAELEPPYLERWPLIVPPGVDYSAIGSSALERAEAARPFSGPSPYEGLGSNNWVISGSRTSTGKPLLANDMHLQLTIPAIWYENHLCSSELHITGVTFPGIPGVVAGHNEHVAWGFTNGFPDVQDLYMERLRRTADGRVQAEYNGAWYDTRVLHESIHVKGGETVVEEVIVTRHGPIINSLAPDLTGEQPLALRWTSLEPDTMIHALSAMNRAHNCLEFREALRHWTAPVQNIVYADTDGNIAYSLPGKVPIRAKGDGRLPVPGWTDEYEWTAYIPFEQLPHLYNPPQGYIATANNRVLGDEYPYWLGREAIMGDRAQRIVELIESQAKIDSAFIRQMHFDQVSPTARAVAQALGQLTVDDPQISAVVQMMREWDGTLSADSPAAAVHEVFIRQAISLLLAQRLNADTPPTDLATRYAGKGPTPVLMERSLFGERSWTWLQKVLAESQSHWFDLGHGETREEVLLLALRQTVDYLKAALGPEMKDWAWGKLHTLTYAHTLGSVKPLAAFFNRGPYPVGGDGTTIWSTATNQHDLDSANVIGPPFRAIMDLSDLRNSLGLLSPGQSGIAGSLHYDDQIEAWFTAGYHPMLFSREDVEREAAHRLGLKAG